MKRYLAAAWCAASLLSVPLAAGAAERTVSSLRLIGEQRIPHRLDFQGTVVGGLSGVDYDPASGAWLLASDDRSALSPARFYSARLDYDGAAFRSVTLTGVATFKQADGSNYPSVKQYDVNKTGDVPDIEALRIDPLDGTVWYTSEGDRKRGFDPFVRHMQRDGAYLGAVQLPEMFRVSREEKGSRDNLSFEGLSFAPDGRSMWVAMESPLYQDGPLPTPAGGAFVRISRMDRDGRMLEQYAYPVDAIPAAPGPGKVADNGVSEIVAVNQRSLLVLERSAVQDAAGAYKNYIRLYEMETGGGASDVRGVEALAGGGFRPAAKRLVLDLNTLGIRLDNLEAMSFGPKLPNGHDSLLIVSDDNFGKDQVTQFLLFEVIPKNGMLN
ncbi:esterase-like activity of phytase family protein [Pseudoduganella aquatica]|uniref:esterase-like activity of phytase family protein n=1 Tax=Pseudoduganella aquatica TaxID=2660641 RepID=UPI001E53F9E0|nr:esterase-like activity of phytase family protein [Pseudoduganella aquatica]